MDEDEIIIELPLSGDDWQDLTAMLADWRQMRQRRTVATQDRSIYVPSPIYVTNVSGAQIPAFACMQVTGTEERSGQNFLEVDQPADNTGAAGPFVFNGPEPIEIGGDGVAQNGFVVRVLTDGGSYSVGDTLGPEASEWAVTAGSFIAWVGGDDIGSNVVRATMHAPQADAIINLRLSGTALQYTKDGTNWITWHTATECPP